MNYYSLMLKGSRIFSCLVPIAFGLAACAQVSGPAPQDKPTASTEKSAPAESTDTRPSALDASLLYEILLGEITAQLGETSDAVPYLLDAAERSGEEDLYRRATQLAAHSHAPAAVRQSIRAWRQAFPDSVEAVRYALELQLALDRPTETQEPLRNLLHALPDDEKAELISVLPALYQRVTDRRAASQAVEAALQDTLAQRAFAASGWTAIGRMRLQAGDVTGALSAATLGQDADADSQWPAVLAMQTMAEQPDASASAEAIVQRYLTRPDAKPEVMLGYAQILIEQGRNDEANQQLVALTGQEPSFSEGWLLRGILDEDQRRNASAQEALQRYLALTEDEAEDTANIRARRAQALTLLASIASRQGNDARAQSWLDRIPDDDRGLAARMQEATILARRGHMDQALQALSSPSPDDEDEAKALLLARAQLMRDHGQAREALELLKQQLAKTPDDTALLYDTAMVAERLDDLAEMEILLRRLIELEPDAAHAYNALGYTFADRGVRLHEALQLIEKAAELAPGDGYVQDSLGWAHFRLGHHQQALDILQAAYDQRPDAEIAAHLGEVYWALGQHEAARSAWAKGLHLDARNKTLRNTMHRLDPGE